MEDLQAYIYEHIPIIRLNNFSVASDGGCIKVSGNYSEHINHRNSVFGGSLSTALILSAWAYVRKIVNDGNCGGAIIVIQSQEVQFLNPVTENFCAKSINKSSNEQNKLMNMINKFGKARINIESVISHLNDDKIRAKFNGDFVVIKKAQDPEIAV